MNFAKIGLKFKENKKGTIIIVPVMKKNYFSYRSITLVDTPVLLNPPS